MSLVIASNLMNACTVIIIHLMVNNLAGCICYYFAATCYVCCMYVNALLWSLNLVGQEHLLDDMSWTLVSVIIVECIGPRLLYYRFIIYCLLFFTLYPWRGYRCKW